MTIEAMLQAATAHHQAGRLAEAEALYRQVLQQQPNQPDALHLLGLIAHQIGKHDVGAGLIAQAIQIRPTALMYGNLGLVFTALGRLDVAAESFRQALALQPDYAEACFNLGNVLKFQGKLDEAGDCYRKALDLAPGYVDAGYNLGIVLQEQNRPDEAAACYRQAIALQPAHAEAHNNLAGALQTMGQWEEAVRHYRHLIELRPGSAEAHFNLAGVLRNLDETDEAIACCRQAIALHPGLARTHAFLGSLYIDLGQFELADAEIVKALEVEPANLLAWSLTARLRKMTLADADWLKQALQLVAGADNQLQSEEEIALRFAIGKYYDDTSQYDAAFAAFSQANGLRRKHVGNLGRDMLSQRVDALIAAYDTDFFRRQHEGASASERPMLIVGMPRSGTSLTEQIIASHPATFGAGELGFWGNQSDRYAANELSGTYDAGMLADSAAEYEQLLQKYSTTASRIVDKMPGNFWRLGLIATVFPNARIIHTRRNPVDTCLSIYFQNFNATHPYATDLDDLAFYYREYERLMTHWRRLLPPKRFLEVPYEALTADQEGWSRRIIGFLGLEWDERCLDFHKTERKVGTASNWQARQRIYQTSKERWRSYEKHVGPLLGLLQH